MSLPSEPQDLESEAALMGCVLIHPDCLDEISVDFQAGDLYLHQNRWIWSAVERLRRDGQAVDFVTVVGELERNGKLAEVGGAAYLTKLITQTPSSQHADSYARAVLDMSDRRRLLTLANTIARGAYDFGADLDSLRSDVMAQLASAQRLEGGAVHVGRALDELYSEIQAAEANPQAVFGIPTGLADFDRTTAGLQATEMMILAGEPGMGKSLLAAQMASNMAKAGHPGTIYELEMGSKQLTRRTISAMSGVTTKAMRSGTVADHEWPLIVNAISTANGWPLYISDFTGWTTTSLRADLARLKKQVNIEWFVVDYFGLLQDAGDDELEREKRMSGALKRVCNDLELSAIVVHSMNKTGMAAPVKRLQHLSGDSRLSFDADVVCFLTGHIPPDGQVANKNMRTVTFAKFREDEANRLFHLVKRQGLPAFGDYAPDPNASIKDAVRARNGAHA